MNLNTIICLLISGVPIIHYLKNFILAILYRATADKYYYGIAARVSVGAYPLYALYTHRKVFVCKPSAHFAYTSQHIRSYATCTLRIHIATHSLVCHVHTSHTHCNIFVCHVHTSRCQLSPPSMEEDLQ